MGEKFRVKLNFLGHGVQDYKSTRQKNQQLIFCVYIIFIYLEFIGCRHIYNYTDKCSSTYSSINPSKLKISWALTTPKLLNITA